MKTLRITQLGCMALLLLLFSLGCGGRSTGHQGGGTYGDLLFDYKWTDRGDGRVIEHIVFYAEPPRATEYRNNYEKLFVEFDGRPKVEVVLPDSSVIWVTANDKPIVNRRPDLNGLLEKLESTRSGVTDLRIENLDALLEILAK